MQYHIDLIIIPEKKKNSSRRNHECFKTDTDNKTISNVRNSTKLVIESNRYFRFFCELFRKYSRKTRKRNMIKLEILYSLKYGVIENYIKHIVFQLYLSFSYIFGAIFSSRTENTEIEQINLNNDYCEKEDNEFLKKLQNFTSTFKDNNGEISCDDFNENIDNDEMATAKEDSDSSNEEWSDAKDVMTMNISLDRENGIPHIALEEQCISTKNKDLSSMFPKQTEEITKQNNFFHDKENDHSFNDFSIISRLKQDRIKGLKRKTLTEFTVNVNVKKQKIVFDEEKTENHIEYKNESKLREEKCSFLQNDSTQYKSYSSRTPKRYLKRKNIKYKKTTQTGSSDSSDDDDEILPIKAKPFKRRFYKHLINLAIRQSQNENMDEELNYMADNEDSIDGFLQITHERISVFKTSFSTNSGFEKRASETSSTNIITEKWSMTLPGRINSSPRCRRAPPGFPELPQNPPLMNYIFDPQFMSSSNNNNDPISSHPKSMAIIPPAPSPMRHLYYQYPEFMDLPMHVNSSRTLNDTI